MKADPEKDVIGVVTEVKTGKVKDEITPGHIEYARRFMGLAKAYPLWFFKDGLEVPRFEKDHLRISVPYAID